MAIDPTQSRSASVTVRGAAVDLHALGEVLLYRWLMTERTLITGIIDTELSASSATVDA